MLAIIAGQGRLPVILTERLRTDRCDFRVYQMAGFSFDNPDQLPVTEFRLERLGTVINDMVDTGIKSVCLAGAVKRPELDLDQVDSATKPLLADIRGAIRAGDDQALRAIMTVFNDAGLAIRSAQDIEPKLLPPAGNLTKRPPPAGLAQDSELAREILADQGDRDLGQACVIRGGKLIAREDDDGTDAMLAKLIGNIGGTLFKGPKPMQDRRADLPTIGIGSVHNAAQAGLDGIAIQTGGVLVLDVDQVVRACDQAGLFLAVQGPG